MYDAPPALAISGIHLAGSLTIMWQSRYTLGEDLCTASIIWAPKLIAGTK